MLSFLIKGMCPSLTGLISFFGFVVSKNVDAYPVVGFERCYVVEGGGGIYILPVILVFDLA